MSDYFECEMKRLNQQLNSEARPMTSKRSEHQLRVDSFMAQAGQELPSAPTIPDAFTRKLRARLILEEALETIMALGIKLSHSYSPLTQVTCGSFYYDDAYRPDLVGIADGCCDIIVVTTGTLSACGISDMPVQEAIDNSNLQKFGPGSYKREDGKWIKPLSWQPPNISQILKDQGWNDGQTK